MKQRSQNTAGKKVMIIVIVAVIAVLVILALRQSSCCTNPNANSANIANISNTNAAANINAITLTEEQKQILTQESFWIPSLDNDGTYEKSTFENTTSYDFGGGDYVSNMPATAASTIKASLGAPQETGITVDGVSATQITGTSQKDGARVTYILIPRDGRTLFARGSDSFLEEIKTNIQFE